MAKRDSYSATVPHREPAVHSRRRGGGIAARRGRGWASRFPDVRYLLAYRQLLARHKRLIRRVGICSGALAAILMLGCGALWWRLASGPIELDAFTPWLASAIEENFGSRQRVEVGGTQIERTENGGAAVRIRDIVVRDADGTIVAKAPKAEVHVSGLSLLSGRMRAESLNLVGAELHVRIERDGNVTIFAGPDKHPIATASVPVSASMTGGKTKSSGQTPKVRLSEAGTPETLPSTLSQADASRHPNEFLAALLGWIDGIGETGLDGHDLRELGLKDGRLSVIDERNGEDWAMSNISLSVERPRGGGVVVKIGSDNSQRPWGLTAAIQPMRNGFRRIEIEAQQISARDLLRAFRLGDGEVQSDILFTGSLRGEIGPDGVPRALSGRILAGAGSIGDGNGDDGALKIDRAEFKLDWDPGNRVLSVPFQILSGGNRITLLGQIVPPADPSAGGSWMFRIGGGSVVLASAGERVQPLILKQVAISGRFDSINRRFTIEEGDLRSNGIGLALSGSADYSSGELRLNAGFAGKRMSVEDLKRLWPAFVAPKVRDWINEHLINGSVEHITIAVNAPLNTLRTSGPPIPEKGLLVEALVTGAVVRPVQGLPALGDADLTVRITGRTAQIALGKAIADLPSGRKLSISSGLFEVPDTAPHEPPARVHFKIDGPVPAAAELCALDRLREVSSVPFDPATTRGTMSAQVILAMPLKPDLPPGSTNYSITVDANNFSAEHMIMGQRLDATALHVVATPQGFQFKGDVRIAGALANLDYHQARGENDAEIRLLGMLDATARHNLGLDPGNTITGTVPIRLTGRVSNSSDREGRFAVEADLTSAQIDGFLPGWVKAAGKPARLTLNLTTRPQSTRIDDLLIEGAGDGVRGTVELDRSGDLISANFPAYGFSDGDKASLKAERSQDGALRVTMRGDVFDGRGFLRALTASKPAQADKHQTPDIDLDLKFGAVLAFEGEALGNLDLKMSRRAGEIRSFGLSAKIGRNASLTGELQGHGDGRQVVALRSSDAGALFRATDVYSRITGGQLLMTMDAPSGTNLVQQGTLNVRDFTIHDEAELQRAAASGSQNAPPRNDLQFTSLKVEFTRSPGRVALRDGVVRGPVLGGTMDGVVDYTRDKVDLRGTLLPLYGPNNLLGWIPVVGTFFGGQKEGVFGFTYQVVGRPGKPVLDVNIISVLAPGILRKIFEYPAAIDNNHETP